MAVVVYADGQHVNYRSKSFRLNFRFGPNSTAPRNKNTEYKMLPTVPVRVRVMNGTARCKTLHNKKIFLRNYLLRKNAKGNISEQQYHTRVEYEDLLSQFLK